MGADVIKVGPSGTAARLLLESSRVNVRGPGLTFNVKRYTLPA